MSNIEATLILEQYKKDVELIKSRNFEEIDKRFNIENECKNCYFCFVMKPIFKNQKILRNCLLQETMLKDNVVGCLGGYKLKGEINEQRRDN